MKGANTFGRMTVSKVTLGRVTINPIKPSRRTLSRVTLI
jgi:hypothetical protein